MQYTMAPMHSNSPHTRRAKPTHNHGLADELGGAVVVSGAGAGAGAGSGSSTLSLALICGGGAGAGSGSGSFCESPTPRPIAVAATTPAATLPPITAGSIGFGETAGAAGLGDGEPCQLGCPC